MDCFILAQDGEAGVSREAEVHAGRQDHDRRQNDLIGKQGGLEKGVIREGFLEEAVEVTLQEEEK